MGYINFLWFLLNLYAVISGKCKDCGSCRVLFSVKKTQGIDLDTLNKTYQERNSTPSTARIFGISHVTVWNYLKKKAQSLAEFKTTIEPAKAGDQLELDEIFTYYTLKVNQIRIWIALNKRNRQIVSFHIGDE
jgi:hypothetical protein